MTPRLERDGAVHVLTLGEGPDVENRLDEAALDAWTEALAGVEGEPAPAALVTRGGGRFYSNGYDLEWLGALSLERQRAFVARHQALLARLLLSGVPSVAALDGHAVGGGALLALAHDFRVMRADRARFVLPEIDARIPFRPGMVALLRARLAPATCQRLVLTGEPIDGAEALRLAVVDETAGEGELLERAVARAAALAAKDRRTYARMKQRFFAEVAAALDPPA